MEKTIVKANSADAGVPFKRQWSFCVGAGRANEGLRADWQGQLKEAVKQCGFQYIRFHGLFHDDMFVYRVIDGREVFSFQYIDSLFDSLLSIGIRPFVELSFCPKDLASGSETQFWWKCNITPPSDFTKWGGLVERAARHWVERYGIDEVSKWYFEVWNEPNLYNTFWTGMRAQYFELYRVSAEALKRVDGCLRVGGPATSNFVPDSRFEGETEDTSKHLTFMEAAIDSLPWKGVWIEEFLQYCEKNRLPADFISTHPYPTDFALDSEGKMRGLSRNADSTRQDMLWLKRAVEKSAFPRAEIHLTEWSSSPSPRDCSHDQLPAAAYIAKCNIDGAGLADSLSYWVFTDIFEEGGGGPEAFHGGFGLINAQGIKKPAFHAYRMLNGLGGLKLASGDGFIATKEEAAGKAGLLLFNYPDECKAAVPIAAYPGRAAAERIEEMGEPRAFSIEVTGLPPGAPFILETLDRLHGCATTRWAEMGHPAELTPAQVRELAEYAEGTEKRHVQADGNGILKLDIMLQPWGLTLLRQI
jgi:xylan 1,4-beta-xylosidase